MNDLLSGLVGVLLATNQPAAVSNLVERSTGITIEVPDKNDPVEREYLKLMADDNIAHVEIDQWIRDNEKFQNQGTGIADVLMKLKIQQRLEPVRKAYDDFLTRHPKHVKARIAYGSFLNDRGEEQAAAAQWEKAREIDPANAAILNNLANHFGHNGPIKKAFEYYQKAIDLDPAEPVYYHNLGTTVFMFRKDAGEFYGITEQQVFDKAMALYSKGLKLDPKNFPLATDVAKSYYGIQPKRPEDAKQAWSHALTLAADEIEREGVYLHLARWEIVSTNWSAASNFLNRVTNEMYLETKTNVLKTLDRKRAEANGELPGKAARP